MYLLLLIAICLFQFDKNFNIPGVYLESESGEEYQAEEEPVDWDSTNHALIELLLRKDKPCRKTHHGSKQRARYIPYYTSCADTQDTP